MEVLLRLAGLICLGLVVALILVGVPLGCLFPPEFQSEVIARCLMILE